MVEETMMHHRQMMQFRNAPIYFVPSHMKELMQMHDIRDMKDNINMMDKQGMHNLHDMKSMMGNFHR